ncbi:MAG: DUF167 domain-containing protein [Nitrospinae bacterium]|nr:DUF167 domain-containing protein [Nitrospinota bacterium]
MIGLREEADGVSFEVRVQPRSSKTEISGIQDGILRVRLTSPPVDGAANRQCIELLSRKMKIPKRAIRIASGASARRKRLKVLGLGVEEMKNILSDLAQGAMPFT